MGECAQDAEDHDLGGEDAEADGGDHGKAKDKRHQERNHGCKSFGNKDLAKLAASASVVPSETSRVVGR